MTVAEALTHQDHQQAPDGCTIRSGKGGDGPDQAGEDDGLVLRDTRFRDVDGSGDPADQVAYLEAVSGLDGARAYKRRSFETLRVRPGARILDVGCGTGEDLRELAGLVRVAHRGARVVVCDTDWGPCWSPGPTRS